MGTTLLKPGQPSDATVPPFKSGSQPAAVTFAFQNISPPAGLYVQRDDVLVVAAASQLATEKVTVTVRILLPFAVKPSQPDQTGRDPASEAPAVGPGYVQTISATFSTGPALGGSVNSIVLAEGYLLSVTAQAVTENRTGQTFVRVYLNRGAVSLVNPNAFALLFADYVTRIRLAGWPSGRVVGAADGPGFIQAYTPANPALGADFTITTNGPGRVRIASLTALLTTSAVAGNRVPSFTVTDNAPGTLVYAVQDTAAILASTKVRYSVVPGGTNVRGAGAIATEQDITMPLPSPILTWSTFGVSSVTQGILGGDQWSAITMITEEWLDAI
jgi:hypothetical protein